MAQIVCKNLAVGYGNTVVKNNINFMKKRGEYIKNEPFAFAKGSWCG